ncbi:MAG TPA: helix-turn-helix domain-containing protein [Streptomyces sp.]
MSSPPSSRDSTPPTRRRQPIPRGRARPACAPSAEWHTRAARPLSVHRDTVRQRSARCAALRGTDRDDMDVRRELWLALPQD